MSLTVRESLGLEPLVHARVVAGAQSLDREIKSVSVIEVPDVWRWLHGGEMLLTTCYPVRNDPDAQVALVQQLAQKNVSALIVKPRRFLDAVPERMVQAADELGLPLLELPLEISFVDVINSVLGQILGEEIGALRESQNLTRQLLDMVAEGRGLQAMVSLMARVVGNPVTFHSAEGKLLAVTADQNAEAVLTSTAALDPRRLASLAAKGPAGRRPVKATKEAALEPALVVPAEANGRVYGYLAFWETLQPVGQAIAKLAGSMALAAALEVGRQQAAEKVERRYLSAYLQQLVSGRLNDEVAAQQASSLGLKLYGHGFPIIISATAPIDRIEAVAREVTSRFNPEGLVAAMGDVVAVIWQLAQTQTQTQTRTRTQTARAQTAHAPTAQTQAQAQVQVQAPPDPGPLDVRLTQWFNDLTGTLACPCTVVVGAQSASLKELAESYSGVKKALKTLKHLGAKGSRMVFTRDLAVLRLIASCPEEELAAFRETVLGPLLRHDAGRDLGLTETLRQFLACNGNIRAASERLFVHANTLKYRLKRIEELTGLRLEDGDARIALAVAFLADDLLGYTG